MGRICGGQNLHSGPDVKVSSVVAVVDKIPGKWLLNEERINDCEGVSLMLQLPSSSPSQQHAFSDDASASGSKAAQSKTFLEFNSALGGLGPADPNNVQVSYKVPLANTLFVNGRHTTLVQTSWKGGSGGGFEPYQGRSLNNFQFQLQLRPMGFGRSVIPLVPLTRPRIVMKAMGNIISEIEVDKKAVPASTELEAAVMASIKKIPRESAVEPNAQIYALIRPPSALPARKEVPPHVFEMELKTGARLYRVIGGGGGWGAKKGLLALDPANSTTNAPRPSRAVDFSAQSIMEAPDTVMSLAKEGSIIQFYQLQHNLVKAEGLGGSSNGDEEPDAPSLEGLKKYNKTRGTAWSLDDTKSANRGQQNIIIGTIPTRDIEPALPAAGLEALDSASDCLEFPGVFGALSESTIEMEVRRHCLGDSPNVHERLPQADHASESRMISVPYSYMVFGLQKRGRYGNRRRKPRDKADSNRPEKESPQAQPGFLEVAVKDRQHNAALDLNLKETIIQAFGKIPAPSTLWSDV